jgi:hypothetical protein
LRDGLHQQSQGWCWKGIRFPNPAARPETIVVTTLEFGGIGGRLERERRQHERAIQHVPFFSGLRNYFRERLFCGKASQRCRQTVCCISVLTCRVSIVAWACSHQPIAPNLTRFPIEVRPLKSCVFDQCQRSEISGAWTGNPPNNATVLPCQSWHRGLCDLSRFVPAVSLSSGYGVTAEGLKVYIEGNPAVKAREATTGSGCLHARQQKELDRQRRVLLNLLAKMQSWERRIAAMS